VSPEKPQILKLKIRDNLKKIIHQHVFLRAAIADMEEAIGISDRQLKGKKLEMLRMDLKRVMMRSNKSIDVLTSLKKGLERFRKEMKSYLAKEK